MNDSTQDTSAVGASAAETITVEVAYAEPDQQKIVSLQVPPGTTARAAARLSGISELFPTLDVDSDPMGIFSQVLGSKGLPGPDEYVLQPMDRVEIYRPLLADPKEVRKQRAAKARQAGDKTQAEDKTQAKDKTSDSAG